MKTSYDDLAIWESGHIINSWTPWAEAVHLWLASPLHLHHDEYDHDENDYHDHAYGVDDDDDDDELTHMRI